VCRNVGLVTLLIEIYSQSYMRTENLIGSIINVGNVCEWEIIESNKFYFNKT
jgi:hypothetical protein